MRVQPGQYSQEVSEDSEDWQLAFRCSQYLVSGRVVGLVGLWTPCRSKYCRRNRYQQKSSAKRNLRQRFSRWWKPPRIFVASKAIRTKRLNGHPWLKTLTHSPPHYTIRGLGNCCWCTPVTRQVPTPLYKFPYPRHWDAENRGNSSFTIEHYILGDGRKLHLVYSM